MNRWDTVAVAEIAHLLSGGTPPKADEANWKGKVPWVSPKDMKRRFLDDVPDHISTEAAQAYSTIAPAKSVLVVVRGMILAKDFPVALIRRPMAINQDMKAIVPNDSVDPEFLLFALLSRKREIQPEIGSSAHGTRRISTESVERVKIPFPPRHEQHAIAAILSKIQDAIDVQTSRVATLKELTAATMAKIFREGLRCEPLKHTEIGEMPESWSIARLSEVCSLSSGGTPPKDEPSFWTGPVPWLSPKDMKRPLLHDTTDHISQEAAAKFSRLAPAGAVFVVVRGMVLAKDFPVAISSVPMAFNQDMKALVASAAVNSNYLLYALIARKDAIRTEIGSSAHGTRRLGSSSLERLPIPIPPPDDQTAIATVLQDIDRASEIASSKKRALLELFDATLDSLMTGALNVSDVRSPGAKVQL